MSCSSSREPGKLCLEADCASCLQDLTWKAGLGRAGSHWTERGRVLLQEVVSAGVGTARTWRLGQFVLLGPLLQSCWEHAGAAGVVTGDGPQVAPSPGTQRRGAGNASPGLGAGVTALWGWLEERRAKVQLCWKPKQSTRAAVEILAPCHGGAGCSCARLEPLRPRLPTDPAGTAALHPFLPWDSPGWPAMRVDPNHLAEPGTSKQDDPCTLLALGTGWSSSVPVLPVPLCKPLVFHRVPHAITSQKTG